MKQTRQGVGLLLFVVLLTLTGCPSNTGGPTGPADAPQLTGVTVNSAQVNSGAVIIFFVSFVDISGDLNGGTAVVTDTLNNVTYNPVVSNAESTAGTLTLGFQLNPLSLGTIVFNIMVFDRAGNPSNTLPATVQVL
jgi:hypothetical protein